MLCTYVDLKTKCYEIAVILSSIVILFNDDSTFCSEVTCFERNLSVSHFHHNIYSLGVNLFNLRRLSKSITSNFIWITKTLRRNNQLSSNYQINKLTYVSFNAKQQYANCKMVSIFNIFHKISHIPIPIILIQLVDCLYTV